MLAAPEALTNAVTFIAEQRPPPPLAELQNMVTAQTFLALGHVRNNTYFVLLTSVVGAPDAGVFSVNDPNHDVPTYTYGEIGDVLLYRINPTGACPATRIPKALSLFKQCNSSWGSDVMVHKTVCEVGCLMSSVSMGLNGNDVAVAGATATPGTLNAWLRTHKGYSDGDDLEESALPRINATAVRWPADGMHTTNDLPYMTIRSYILQGRTVVANVMKGGHFVLATGWDYADADRVLVNDPGFNTTAYSYSNDIVGWRLFDIADAWVAAK